MLYVRSELNMADFFTKPRRCFWLLSFACVTQSFMNVPTSTLPSAESALLAFVHRGRGGVLKDIGSVQSHTQADLGTAPVL